MYQNPHMSYIDTTNTVHCLTGDGVALRWQLEQTPLHICSTILYVCIHNVVKSWNNTKGVPTLIVLDALITGCPLQSSSFPASVSHSLTSPFCKNISLYSERNVQVVHTYFVSSHNPLCVLPKVCSLDPASMTLEEGQTCFTTHRVLSHALLHGN